MRSHSNPPEIRNRARGRSVRYLGSTLMQATAGALALTSSTLKLDIVELWSLDGESGKLNCTYVQANESFLLRFPEIITGHFPNHKQPHKLSPEVKLLY